MTDHEAGYLRALIDTQVTVVQMLNDHSASAEGKRELLTVLSFLDDMIKAKMALHGGRDKPGRANEISRALEE